MMALLPKDLAAMREYLEEQYLRFNRPSFIEKDPVSIPHSFTKKEDIEISGFLAATIAWGNRASIVCDGMKLMQMMDQEPHDFILNASDEEMKLLGRFYHRTFNGTDCLFFIRSIRNIYSDHGGLESLFSKKGDLKEVISSFKKIFQEIPHEVRSEKHIADPMKGAAAKRILMFLRWMVRDDGRGVDFGLWKGIRPSQLYIPLDVHVANTARSLGLLTRNANDWKAVEELTEVLRLMDPADPVKYDYALFGSSATRDV